MQVYLAVQNAENKTIIVKKREFNGWWSSKTKRDRQGCVKSSLVNQAGQWALPGGKKEDNESLKDAAAREFKEETGIPLNLTTKEIQVVIQNKNYALVRVQIGWAQSVLDQINANVQPNQSDTEKPNSPFVQDWELGEAKLVKVDELENYLGVFQEVSTPAQAARKRARRYSQDIDWYAAMAKALSEAS